MDLDTLLQGYRDAVTVRQIYGDPVEHNGVTVVPAAAVIGSTGGPDVRRPTRAATPHW
jgi:hypothetical protein